MEEVFNYQMIIDLEVNSNIGFKNFITISKPVLQRMIHGKTLGIVIKPLGTVDASFFQWKMEKPPLNYILT